MHSDRRCWLRLSNHKEQITAQLLSWGMTLLIVLNCIPRSVAEHHSEHQKGKRTLLRVQWKSSARNLIHSWLGFDGCEIMSWGSFFFCLCYHLPHSALPKYNQQLHISLKITEKSRWLLCYTLCRPKYVVTIDFRNLIICLEKLQKCMFIAALCFLWTVLEIFRCHCLHYFCCYLVLAKINQRQSKSL